MQRHKNKTFAAFLASFLGAFGIHRFYLHGWKDFWGWAHLIAALLSIPALFPEADMIGSFVLAPLVLSMLAAVIEALVIGLMPDERWDARHNAGSGRQSRSGWPLAVIIVFTTGFGAILMIAAMARTFDLLLTGGSYG